MRKTELVVGYHGTTKAQATEILRTGFMASTRPGLWLGYGRYFFQDAPVHAYRWARHLAVTRTGSAANAAVLLADIDLTACLDLTDRQYWPVIRGVWESEVRGTGLQQLGVDEVFRRLDMSPQEVAAMTPEERNALAAHEVDCHVMNIFIQQMKNKVRPAMDYTTVRAAVVEGEPVYSHSWLWNRSAVVISVLEPEALKSLAELTDDQIIQLRQVAS